LANRSPDFPAMKKILILAANPRGDLKLDREIRDLEKAIDRAVGESEFEVKLQVAVRPEDLQELFLKHKPRIVHFCGHGAGVQGLVFVDDDAREQLVSTDAIADLFRIFTEQVHCAVFNACDSDVQAEAIAQHIEYAIGMRQAILDQAAYWFAIGFYRGLGYGESIDFSYELGCNAIAMELLKSGDSRKFELVDPIAPALPEHLKPVLRKRAASSDRPSVSLPAEFAEAIAAEGNLKRYQDRARETWDGIGRSPAPTQPLTQHEYRQRRVFVGKVKEFWIEGFLKRSLIGEAIELGLQARPDAVQRPFAEIPAELDQSFEQLRETSLFEQIGQGKTLLILGEPGAGKTIALLKLAERLVEQTDLSQPMPVVLNLASWASRRQPIADWLVEELREKYQVPKALSKPWIEQEQLILLLDGLDEVKAEYRNDCVRSLNQFIETHSVTDLVICSRVRDYEDLLERLKLSSAICLQPLTAEQVDRFLATSESLAGLRSQIQQDSELKKFAQTPLILNIMSSAYADWAIESLMQQFSVAGNRYEHLFDTYVDRILQRRDIAFPYPKEKVLQWLCWLARQMIQNKQIVFLIREIQPTWLETRFEKRIYYIGTFLGYGLIFGLIYGLVVSHLTTGIFFALGPLLSSESNYHTALGHFTLRLILYHADRIPWNYARFLDFASDRLLLKKVGGGYLFYHRMLMEHLAQQ
jgi:NACHT domain/CHAT domain